MGILKLLLKLELIIDYRTAFLPKGNVIESKGVQFPSEMLLIKLIWAGNLQLPVIPRKWLALICTT